MTLHGDVIGGWLQEGTGQVVAERFPRFGVGFRLEGGYGR